MPEVTAHGAGSPEDEPPNTDLVHRVGRAFGHPLRARMLYELARAAETEGVSSVQLSKKLGAPLGSVSYHMKFLNKLMVLDFRWSRPVRGSKESFYSLRAYVVYDFIVAVSQIEPSARITEVPPTANGDSASSADW